MAAKTRKDSIYVIHEGYREGYFLEHLEKYSKVRLNLHHCNGGSANQIVSNGIKYSARDVNVYVFFDEDFESKPEYTISDETMEGLEIAWKSNNTLKGCAYRNLHTFNKEFRNPILIVSFPHSIEGLLLRLIGISIQELEGKNTKYLKNRIDGYLNNISLNNEDSEKLKSYDKKISRYSDEIVKLQKNEPYKKNQCRFLEEKIKECDRNKNKVTFMRFLCDKLPLPVIAAKRVEIPEMDILLKAFGL